MRENDETAPPLPRTRTNPALLAAKVVVAATLIALLLAFKLIDIEALRSIPQQPRLAVLATLIFFGTLPLSATRWWLLLRAQSIHISWVRCFHVSAIGQFFNIFMPGGIGGDALRFYYIFDASKGRRAAAATSLIVDRAVGLGGLLIVTSVLMLLEPGALTANTALHPITQIFAVAIAVAACGLLVLVLPGALVRAAIRPLLGWGRLGQFIHGGFEAIGLYRRQKAALCWSLGLSVLIQCATVAGFVTVAAILALPGLTWLEYAIAAPLALVVNMLPVSPGGIGIGEGTFGLICRLMSGNDAAPYATIFFVVRTLSAIAALYGGLVWTYYRKPAHAP